MKKIAYILTFYLCFSVVLTPISSSIALAKTTSSNFDLINNATHNTDFDWDSVRWEETYFENSNDSFPVYLDEQDENIEIVDLEPGEVYDGQYHIINEEDFPKIQPRLWNLVARVVLSGGQYVVKFGSRIFKKQPASAAQVETIAFQSATVNIGNGNTVLLQRSSMVHILQQHHPRFWTGSTGKTLFNPNITTSQLRSQIIQILNQNRHKIDLNGYGRINVMIEGQVYRLVVSNNRVTTFYPVGL
ncbi:hypothetical protein [Lysinibacillus varians]|uniref:Uncharacterized protein n=1 Tax=Lysinibacillus varians TaxID=1145276 RepID=A0ABY2T6H3_9BACI|nr:hypothetical protein [Lysinibacillus varians]AHN23941.1 hypothetical protein T479_02570 [Lysinibacillus varians]TKI59670.1 hypothetical protein FC752_17700 [Lysinibacillus varians]